MNVTVTQDFFDGSLAGEFTKLGYPAKWKSGEKRDLPEMLIKRIVSSGGVITIPSEGAKESYITPQAAKPAPVDYEKVYKEKNKKEKFVRVVFPEGFRDGSLAAECAAIGHPAEFGVGEIVELPKQLYERIVASGGLVSENAEEMKQYVNQQLKHKNRVLEWQEAHKREAERIASKAENAEHNQKLQTEIEELSGQVLTAKGKTKEALWQRIRELRSQIR